jgi:hypothetical protein
LHQRQSLIDIIYFLVNAFVYHSDSFYFLTLQHYPLLIRTQSLFQHMHFTILSLFPHLHLSHFFQFNILLLYNSSLSNHILFIIRYLLRCFIELCFIQTSCIVLLSQSHYLLFLRRDQIGVLSILIGYCLYFLFLIYTNSIELFQCRLLLSFYLLTSPKFFWSLFNYWMQSFYFYT